MKRFIILSLVILFAVIPPVGHLVTAQVYTSRIPGNSPVWESNNGLSVFAGQGIMFTVRATDPNGDSLTYWPVQLPANATFDAVSKTLTFNPTLFQVGTQEIILAVTDYKTPPVESKIFIDVVDNQSRVRGTSGIIQTGTTVKQNNPPTFTTSKTSYSVVAGQSLQFSVSATDSDGDFVTYTVSGVPAGSRFNRETRVFSWTPAFADVGTHTVVFKAGDGRGLGSALPVIITVTAPEVYAGFFGSQPITPIVQTPTPQPTPVYTQEPTVIRVPVYITETVTEKTVDPTVITARNYYRPEQTNSDIATFGISVRRGETGETLVSWLTNMPTTGEVVFGKGSHGGQEAQIWNYDFTSGETASDVRHEVNLGQLVPDQTYYMRVVSRANGDLDVTREVAFVPFTTTVVEEGVIASVPPTKATGLASLIVVTEAGFTAPYLVFTILILIIFMLLYLLFRPVSSQAPVPYVVPNPGE